MLEREALLDVKKSLPRNPERSGWLKAGRQLGKMAVAWPLPLGKPDPELGCCVVGGGGYGGGGEGPWRIKPKGGEAL